MITEFHSSDAINEVPDTTFSRRGLGKRLLLGASALAVLLASKHHDAQAAPTTPWVLGGNTILTNGTEFLGTKNVAPLIFKTAATANTPLERMRITPTGNVGIGITTPAAKLQVYSTTYAIYARHTAQTGTHPAVQGETAATVANASGVLGKVMATAPGTSSAGVLGVNNGTNGNGAGVRGSHAGGGIGVHGTSVNGTGVRGEGYYIGIQGQGTAYGLYGSGEQCGVAAKGTGASSTGADCAGTQYGVCAYARNTTGYAGFFVNTASSVTEGVGVHGLGAHGSSALIHPRGLFMDGGGEFSGPNGLIGAPANSNGYGVLGIQGPGAYAMYAYGNMYVTGTFAAGGTKNFEIDHPQDPANKILRHAAVESSEVKNTYDGTVTLQEDGTATVTLPDWMEALNKDFRYQLTAIGAPGPNLHIAEKINNNRFKIAGGLAGMEVCWQLIGIRNDKYMQEHPLEVESEKKGADRGTYLAPELFGQPAEKGHGQLRHTRAEWPRPAAPAHPQAPPGQ